MRAPGLVGAILLVSLSTACASSGGARHERTSGYFDEDSSGSSDAREERGGYAPAPASAPMSPMTDAVQVSESGVQGRAMGGAEAMFEFADDVIEGALAKPDGAKAEQRPINNEPVAPKPGEPVPSSTGDKPPMESSAAKRLVIYKGSLVVMVPVVEASIEKLSARATELGGYVENQSGNSGANNGTVTLRVPAEKFYALVNELGSYGQVTQKNVSASDVTKTVFDIELRMETAEKSRQRLLDLLKSATKMEEILQIENEVRRLTTEIEAMKGELRFLKDQVAFSTLAVTFYSNAPPPNAGPTRTRSRFEWINQVGIENVLYNF